MDREWTIEAVPSEMGVDLRIVLPTEGEPLIAVLRLDRTQARALGRAVLAAAGDAMERTFPAPHAPFQE